MCFEQVSARLTGHEHKFTYNNKFFNSKLFTDNIKMFSYVCRAADKNTQTTSQYNYVNIFSTIRRWTISVNAFTVKYIRS